LALINDFVTGKGFSLAQVQHYIFLQAVYDPYRKLPEFQLQPEDADIEVPEEHENSVLRDMEVLDKYETLQ
jgi:hypothetical protein